ncbi:MAG: translation initiation factor IF-3 [Bacteroidetes bacterium]|nr:translation initiation factor IF-3 [Bacteroidota bacterium]
MALSRPPRGRGPQSREQKAQHRINDRIRAKEVRVVGENVDSSQVVPLKEALQMADDMDLDLVEISPNADPPVCKITDYQKFLYQQKKKQKELKSKQAKIVVKEIRFGPNTDEHDFNFKLNHAKKFLSDGAKVKAYVFFKGRSIVYKDQGEIMLLRFANELEELGKVEQMPKLEGKRMTMILTPNSTGKGKKKE